MTDGKWPPSRDSRVRPAHDRAGFANADCLIAVALLAVFFSVSAVLLRAFLASGFGLIVAVALTAGMWVAVVGVLLLLSLVLRWSCFRRDSLGDVFAGVVVWAVGLAVLTSAVVLLWGLGIRPLLDWLQGD